MKFLVAAILVTLAVAAFAQSPSTQSSGTASAATSGSTGGIMGGGMGNLMTLGLLTGRGMGGDFMRDMMYCNMMRLPPMLCMGGMM